MKRTMRSAEAGWRGRKAAGSRRHGWVGAALVLLGPAILQACILCPSQGSPLGKEIGDAKLVVFGSIRSAQAAPDGIGGTSEFAVDALIKGEQSLVKGKTITLPRYVPPAPGVKYLVFLDVNQGRVDPYRTIVCGTDRIVAYLQKMPPLSSAPTPGERQARLVYCFEYLNDAEPEIAADAFKEWAAATNADVASVAGKLDAGKLRRWILDPKTPAHCLGLFAYLLGSCGGAEDAVLLRQLIENPPNPRLSGALDGLLAGYLRVQPKEGWSAVQGVITKPGRGFSEGHAVLRMLRFVHDVQGEKHREQILRSTGLLLEQNDLVDLAIETLRRWQWWEHTERVLKVFDAAQTQAPITRRAVVRYALSCPLPAAKTFIVRLRGREPDLVKDVEEGMVFEQPTK
jgi:hypothetical protein